MKNKEDNQKLIEIFQLYKKRMFYIANSILKNTDNAEDAVQNALIRIAKNINNIKCVNSPKTFGYIAIITKNVSIDLSKKLHNFEDIEEIEYKLLDYTNIENVAISDINYDLICKKIEDLKDPYKDILTLYYVYDLSCKKIAKILNKNYSTVKTQLVRGRKKIVECLKEVG